MSIPLAATAATSAFTVAAACWSRLPCVPHYASARVRVPAGVQAPARDLGAERAARTVSSPTGNRRQHVSNLPPELRSIPLDLGLFPRSTLCNLLTNSFRCHQRSRVTFAAVMPNMHRRERPKPGHSRILPRYPTSHNRSSPRSPRPHEYGDWEGNDDIRRSRLAQTRMICCRHPTILPPIATSDRIQTPRGHNCVHGV